MRGRERKKDEALELKPQLVCPTSMGPFPSPAGRYLPREIYRMASTSAEALCLSNSGLIPMTPFYALITPTPTLKHTSVKLEWQ